ncbi:hypothetical protein CROQUDRAFT_97086 [Cronartium quercuum f. sp. fusiforme G11]|uniref:P-loop containing nucleoside triphosphate hydrolase protein n=1 Tax=Cronartium quercuum f. sp. fusiforme G11 TaxID=708437 RepID=A0A9P6NBY8_9BASI|nr:hypothetical protein CROQUDRAFT_97086 [Cronartium quercuum f. sp. fusiforme G11]
MSQPQFFLKLQSDPQLHSPTASTLVGFPSPTSPTSTKFPTTEPGLNPSTSNNLPPDQIPTAPQVGLPEPKPLSRFPALSLIFSFTNPLDYVLLLIPACLCCIVAGLIPPYMTILIGEAFEAFTLYTLTENSFDFADAKHTLRTSIGSVSLRLILIGLASCLLSLLNHTLWSIYAARICEKLQVAIYNALSARHISWFDNGLPTSHPDQFPVLPPDESQDTNGRCLSAAAGVMSRFSRETDEVRTAISSCVGFVLQYSVTFLANVVLAFTKSYKLSLVILATIPLIAIITAVISVRVAPLIALQNTFEASLSGELTRVIRSITLVKAFNAQPLELLNLNRLSRQLSQNYDRIISLSAFRLGTTHSLALLMFVQGFGFGSHLIATGQVTPGDVNTVFWSSLVASTHMQMAIPLLSQLEHVRPAILDLLTFLQRPSAFSPARVRRPSLIPLRELNRPVSKPMSCSPSIGPPPPSVRPSLNSSTTTDCLLQNPSSANLSGQNSSRRGGENGVKLIESARHAGSRIRTRQRGRPHAFRPLRKLIPSHFQGQLEFEHVSFAYPAMTGPSPGPVASDSTSIAAAPVPVLRDVSMFFPAGDLTFVLGESGSGKSTVAVLALGLYSPEKGTVTADELGSISGLDPAWIRAECLFLGSLSAQFLLPGTIHDNIALGACPRTSPSAVTREQVIRAARFALLHDFISGLPDGYDTVLAGHDSRLSGLVAEDADPSTHGEASLFAHSVQPTGSLATLSGGQLQRLGLARAYLRNPTVLILDEPVSALDLVSQSLLAAAIRHWRSSKTTIWITHDLSPIEPDDFVYLLESGRVVEADYLGKIQDRMATRSHHPHNSLVRLLARPTLPALPPSPPQPPPILDAQATKAAQSTRADKRLTFFDGFLRVLHPRSAPDGFLTSPLPSASMRATHLSHTPAERTSIRASSRLFLTPLGEIGRESREAGAKGKVPETGGRPWLRSRPTTPSSLTPATSRRTVGLSARTEEEDAETEAEYREIALALVRVGKLATERRGTARERRKWDDPEKAGEGEKRTRWGRRKGGGGEGRMDGYSSDPSLVWLLKKLWGTLECRVRMGFGVAISALAGILTPVFSALLGQLLARLANPPKGYILRQSLLIAAVSIVDGLCSSLRIWLMEGVGTSWLEGVRARGLKRVVLKDLSWFESPQNESSKIVNRFIKDGIEARELVSQILADLLTIITLLIVAFGWAMVVGWELTLVGLSLAPIFFIVIGGGGKILGRLEHENKRWRESVAMEFHLTMNQMKAIRILSIEGVMRDRFVRSVVGSKRAFIRASPVGGIPYGLNTAMAYSAQALMFYVGSQWVVEGRYSFEKLTQVFSLIIFSVTFAGQMIGYVPSISRSSRAFIDLLEILEMSVESKEIKGELRTNLTRGEIKFQRVSFAYPNVDIQTKSQVVREKDRKPQRNNAGGHLSVPVLRKVSFSVRSSECVGIVGPSGSGKSTIASLLQRFYEPDQGRIMIDGVALDELQVNRLRDQIGVVTQHPMLSNEATILENICYGHMSVGDRAAEATAWAALEDVNLASLVRARPEGLHSRLGTLSSGEAERLAIARMLVSRQNRTIVILDEPTAALDLLNQRIILKTIMRLKEEGKTMILITHQMSVMRACDRLVVLEAGQVVETGSVDELVRDRPNGVFATLARGGEWGGG